MIDQTPTISDTEADRRFKEIAGEMNLDPDGLWIGGYVKYEWQHGRYLFERHDCNFKNANVLEFGCNVGATAIVLALLGAKVTAIDINENYLNLAKANAERYGVSDKIDFMHVSDTTNMRFADNTFDYITCNSVLEYVDKNQLPLVQKEINRVLKKHGIIFLLGTSNRLWPREVHSKRWFTNYLPTMLDAYLFKGKTPERGVSPWRLRYGFGDYENLDRKNNCREFFQAKQKMGLSKKKLLLLKTTQTILSPAGISVGLIMPSISLTLKKL